MYNPSTMKQAMLSGAQLLPSAIVTVTVTAKVYEGQTQFHIEGEHSSAPGAKIHPMVARLMIKEAEVAFTKQDVEMEKQKQAQIAQLQQEHLAAVGGEHFLQS